MIEFDEVTSEWFGPVSFKAGEGGLVKVIATSREAASGFTSLAAGLVKPRSGRVLLFGQDLEAISEEEYVALMERVGLVTENGGMISNLKAGENVVLPAMYHGKKTIAELDALTGEAFTLLNIPIAEGAAMMSLPPARLKPFQSRILRMIRAFSTGPDILIHEEIAGGLPAEMAASVIQWAEMFHKGEKGRVSVFITSHQNTLEKLQATATIHLAHAAGGNKEIRGS